MNATASVIPTSEGPVFQLNSRYTDTIVTDNMQQAARAAVKTSFVLNGRTVESGLTHRFFTSPRDKRTGDYITGRFG